MLLQQGDVLLKKIEVLPKNLKKIKRAERGYVLAEGEATGHAHVVEDEIGCYEREGVLYLKIDTEAPVKHEEHKEVMIPPGLWEVVKVQEYDHFLEESYEVMD